MDGKKTVAARGNWRRRFMFLDALADDRTTRPDSHPDTWASIPISSLGAGRRRVGKRQFGMNGFLSRGTFTMSRPSGCAQAGCVVQVLLWQVNVLEHVRRLARKSGRRRADQDHCPSLSLGAVPSPLILREESIWTRTPARTSGAANNRALLPIHEKNYLLAK